MRASAKLLLLMGGITPQTRAWRDAIIAGGETVSANTVLIVDRMLVRPLLSFGLWDKCYMIDPCVGNGIQASLFRLKMSTGVARKAFTGGFADGDYNERGSSGGRTGNGSSKYIDTLINPSTLGFSTSSFMMWAYTRTAAVGATSRVSFGNQPVSGSITTLGWVASGTTETVGVGAASSIQYAVGSATSLTGFLGGGTNGSRATQFYRNGVAVGGAASGSDGFSNNNIYAFASNSNGTPAGYSNRTISSMMLTQGLTSGEIATINSIVQAFETAIGRNV